MPRFWLNRIPLETGAAAPRICVEDDTFFKKCLHAARTAQPRLSMFGLRPYEPSCGLRMLEVCLLAKQLRHAREAVRMFYEAQKNYSLR